MDSIAIGYSSMDIYPRPVSIKGEYVVRHHELGDCIARLDVLATTDDGLIFAWAKFPTTEQQENNCSICPGQKHRPDLNPGCGEVGNKLKENEIVAREDHSYVLARGVTPWAFHECRRGGLVYAVVYGPSRVSPVYDPDQLLSAKCFAEYCSGKKING